MVGLDKYRRLLASSKPEVRLRAAQTLIRRKDVPLELLLEVFDQWGGLIRSAGLDVLMRRHVSMSGRAVAQSLIKHPDPGVADAMIQRLESGSDGVRQDACEVLAARPSSKAIPCLAKALEDSVFFVRFHAAWALGATGDESAAAPLMERHIVETDSNVLRAIESSLKRLGT